MDIIITDLKARQVLSSRGEPTVEVEITLNKQYKGRAIVPSGASKGKFEVEEIKDKDMSLYKGKSVYKVVRGINDEICPFIIGGKYSSLYELDNKLISLDGTKNKKKYGGNGILGISIAYLKALSELYHLPCFQYIGGMNYNHFPLPMMNVINGGAHSNNSLDIQEFMIVPVGAKSMDEAIRYCVEVYYSLKELLNERGLSISVGDEGGFAPNLKNEEEALDLLSEAISNAGYILGIDFKFSLDIASSEWKVKDGYFLPKKKRVMTSKELMDYYLKIVNKYPILSLEDPFDQEDYSSWNSFLLQSKKEVLLVGDDLYTTNEERLKMGIENKLSNAILIKPNQIGTISETLNCINLAKDASMKVIVSHRSGESEDDFISDLAYGVKADYVKFGAPCRSERTVKYNRLLKIEEIIREQKR